jgi:hypothetical protein
MMPVESLRLSAHHSGIPCSSSITTKTTLLPQVINSLFLSLASD